MDVIGIAYQTSHKPRLTFGLTQWVDHIDYFMVRIDPDKITPLKSEAQSKEYRSKLADGGK